MATPIHVLIVEDSPPDAELMVAALRRGGFDPVWQRVETEATYLAHLDSEPSVILADYTLPQFDAARALLLVQERGQNIPFIVVSGTIGEEVAVDVMRQGASDYLLKDRLVRLAPAVKRALEEKRVREERRQAQQALREAEELYRGIFENAVEGIFQSTPGGQWLTANPAVARMLGYSSPEELIATVQDIGQQLYVHPEQRLACVRLLEERGSVQRFECQFFRKDRTRIWVSLNARVVSGGDGRVLRYDKTIENITELKKNEASLLQYQRELRDLSTKLISTQEEESKRLARELHDVISQELATLAMEIVSLRRDSPASLEWHGKQLQAIEKRIGELARSLHQMSRRLHPAIVYDLGLPVALANECAAFTSQHGIPATCTPGKLPERLPDDVSLCLYRITQESLRNIARHAAATGVLVKVSSHRGQIALSIEDNGCGFTRDQVRGKGGLGLVSMEERVRSVRGRISVKSSPGKGTQVEVHIPVGHSEE